jgi:hypothetical protein
VHHSRYCCSAQSFPGTRMISDVLIPALRARFSDRRMRIEESPRPHVVFPAGHPAVGGVIIWDDGDEVTLEVGEITHGHFNPYDPTLTEDQVAESVTEMVVDFLTELFANRVLLFNSVPRHTGGWRVLEEPIVGIPPEYSGYDAYAWSGPLHS